MRGHAGTIAVVGLLLIAMAFTSVLTWEAVTAERARRTAVNEAIRGYASFVADDLLRRTIFEFEEFNSLPLRRSVATYLAQHDGVPSLDWLRHDESLGGAADLAESVFLVDTQAGRVSPPLAEPLRSWALTQFPGLVRAQTQSGATKTLRTRLGNRDYLLVYGTAQIERGRIFVITMRDSAFSEVAAHAFPRRSAFPSILGGGQLTNRDIFIRMSRNGRELFRSPFGKFDPAFGVTVTAPESFSEVVRGVRVESSIAASAVPTLVVGGVPPSRVPVLIATFVMSAIVLAAAFFVLRRERHLAEMRSDFVSGVSHELRTPLTQIRMFTETLLFDRVRSNEERQHSLQVINEEARRLTNLVDNVLFLSRGRNVAFEPLRRDCDMEMLIGDAIDAFSPLAIRRDVVITADMPPRLHASVDGEAWKQVVTNILDNAVKYGPPGQTVRVQVTNGDGMLRMIVDDEGPGIPPEERDQIWLRFHRLERDRGGHKTGSGLGLAIVREIVARHGGRCWVEDAPERGARFVVEVPIGMSA